jgi:hypothetical protein
MAVDQTSQGTIPELINVLASSRAINFSMQNCNLRTAGVTITNWVAATTQNCNVYMMNNYGDNHFTYACNMQQGTIFNGNFFMLDNQNPAGPTMYWRSQPGHLISFNASTGTTMVITVDNQTFTFDYNNILTLGGLALTNTTSVPTITSGVALSGKAVVATGTAVALTTPPNGGPVTPSKVAGWVEISIGGTTSWIPYFQ